MDGQPPKKRGRLNKRRFRTALSVRTYVGRVLRALEDAGDPGDPDRARVMIYGAKVMAELITNVDLEQRLQSIEKRLMDRDEGVAPQPN